MIDEMVINLWSSKNFASMEYIRRKYNIIVNLAKFISNKKILSRIVAIGRTLPIPYHIIQSNIKAHAEQVEGHINYVLYSLHFNGLSFMDSPTLFSLPHWFSSRCWIQWIVEPNYTISLFAILTKRIEMVWILAQQKWKTTKHYSFGSSHFFFYKNNFFFFFEKPDLRANFIEENWKKKKTKNKKQKTKK